MTPEEKAVIDLCIQEQSRLLDLYGYAPLDDAIVALVKSRESAPEWLPATFVQCLTGDRIRLGSEETVVRWTSALQWHADTSDRYQPKSWDHVELRMDLEAAPGRRPYPPDHACEILCDLERAAILGIQSQFPGTQTS